MAPLRFDGGEVLAVGRWRGVSLISCCLLIFLLRSLSGDNESHGMHGWVDKMAWDGI